MALVIAECCQNHLGDWAILKDMVWAAAEVGADIVKVQSMLAADLVRRGRVEGGVVRDGRTPGLRRSVWATPTPLMPMVTTSDPGAYTMLSALSKPT